MSFPDQNKAAVAMPHLAEETPVRHWFYRPYFQVSVSILLSAAAQIFLKIGADESAGTAALGFSGLHSAWVWLGIVAVVASLLSWLYSLRYIPLNIAANLAGAIHVLGPLASWIFLGEKISASRWFGIFLVIAGVVIIARPLLKMEERL